MEANIQTVKSAFTDTERIDWMDKFHVRINLSRNDMDHFTIGASAGSIRTLIDDAMGMDSTATCKNCKHWLYPNDFMHGENVSTDVYWGNEGAHIKCCLHPVVCHPFRGDGGAGDVMKASGVIAPDDDGYTHGELCTGPDYGCTHFELSEDNSAKENHTVPYKAVAPLQDLE